MKKIASILSLVGLLTACGDETQLSRYVAEPMPRSSEVQRYDYMPPDYNNDSPGLSLNVTMQHCLGPLTDALSDLEILCPIARATGVCDPEFEGNLSGLPERVMEIIREEVPFINPFDLLDGEISIPVTALVSRRLGIVAIYEDGLDEPPVSRFDYEGASMIIMFGDQRDVINEYLNNGEFLVTDDDMGLKIANWPYGNFPQSHIRCAFDTTIDQETGRKGKDQVAAAYIKIDPETGNKEMLAGVELLYHDMQLSASAVPKIWVRTDQGRKLYPQPEYNFGTLKYAIYDIANDGIGRVKEFLDGNFESNSFSNRKIFLWD